MRPGSLCAALAASAFGSMLLVADVSAQTRSLPRFEVEAGWPKVPPQFRVGDDDPVPLLPVAAAGRLRGDLQALPYQLKRDRAGEVEALAY